MPGLRPKGQWADMKLPQAEGTVWAKSGSGRAWITPGRERSHVSQKLETQRVRQAGRQAGTKLGHSQEGRTGHGGANGIITQVGDFQGNSLDKARHTVAPTCNPSIWGG